MSRQHKRKAVIDDGMNPELIAEATYLDLVGIFQTPLVRSPKVLPHFDTAVPFTKRNRQCIDRAKSLLCFHENDTEFADVLIEPQKYVECFRSFAAIEPPDCSLYWNAPLAVQIANHYRMMAIGFYYQHHGAEVIPLVRWGDERTYTTKCLPEKIAFTGYEKHGIVSIGSYGAIRSRLEKFHFRNGLREMLIELEPEIVIVYGAMPDDVFDEFKDMTSFIQFPDWMSLAKKEGIK